MKPTGRVARGEREGGRKGGRGRGGEGRRKGGGEGRRKGGRESGGREGEREEGKGDMLAVQYSQGTPLFVRSLVEFIAVKTDNY